MQYLVIMRLKPNVSRDALAPGVLRTIHLIKGPAGAVLLFEASGEKEVEAQVAQLPRVVSGAVTVETLPLEPFTGWALLFAPNALTERTSR
jgi:hypothetical protein